MLAPILAVGVLATSPQSLAYSPTDPAQAVGLGDYLAATHAEKENDFWSADLYYQSALAADPENIELLAKTIEMALASGDLDRAFKQAETLAKADPNSDLSKVLSAVENYRRRSYRPLLRLDVNTLSDPVYYMLLKGAKAWSLAASQDVPAALALMQEPVRYPWEGWFTSYIIAQIQDWSGDPKAALKTFQPVYLAQQDVAEIVVTLAVLHARAGEMEAGQAVLDRYLQSRSDIEVMSAKSTLDVLAERPIVASPQQALMLLASRLAGDLAAQNEHLRALQLVQLAKTQNAQLDRLAFQEAQILFGIKRYEEAVNALDQVPGDSATSQKALLLKAIAYDQLERTDEAMSLLELALEANYRNFEAIMFLGDLKRQEKKFVEAANTYSRAIEQYEEGDMRFWRFFFNRGVAYERAGMWAKAEPDFIKALEMVPNHPKILNYLGYSWIDQGLNLDEALKMVERAVAISPNDGYIVDSLGWGLYRLGRYEEAVEKLEIAVQLEPLDPIINDHLGDAYWTVGRQREARFQWEAALGNNPEDDLKQQIEKKLENGLSEPAKK